MTLEEQLAMLRRSNQGFAPDKELAEESADLGLETFQPSLSIEAQIEQESIVQRRNRPVFAIRDNRVELVFRESEDSETWKKRLTAAKPALDVAIRAVGRIELSNHRKPWVGTGWLVADDILVTNRHVASEFVVRNGEDLLFSPGTGGGTAGAAVDFLQEMNSDEKLVFRVTKILHVEPEPGPDLAFLRVEQRTGDSSLAAPIPLASAAAGANPSVGVIGYPALDSRIPEPGLMLQIFGNVFDKKRFAPGAVTEVEEVRLHHDCSTLGGNSGSVVLDLTTGEALGLHFSGGFMRSNYAVRSDVIKRLLGRLGGSRSRSKPLIAGRPVPAPRVERELTPTLKNGQSITVTIPLTISLSIGAPIAGKPAAPMPTSSPIENDEDDDMGDEAVATDYSDRTGYAEDFLGDGLAIPLPVVVRGKNDVLRFGIDGEEESVLRYQHYSVVMSKSRRLCLFSAVNVNGGTSRKTKRSGWRTDPRIPKTQQIKGECYGNPPKFSRGHMTRREDPAWGTVAQAALGNNDSMHVTNTVPQMQAFNSPIWLGLEDYALQHAREDRMLISVFTGPYFRKDDPVMFGVQVPTAFWKIIAFVHDETGELCATGYEMADESVAEQEFVFGQFTSPQLNRTVQVSITSIEKKCGLSFGELASRDPLVDGDESVGAPPALAGFDQIRFT
jgi:endonuclease G